MVLTHPVHSISDPEEMLEETVGDFLIHGIVFRQNESDLQHVLAIEGHPCRAIRLVEMTARRKGSTAIEESNIVQPEEAPREDIPSLRILSVDPPVEIQHQTLKRTFQETQIRPAQFSFNVIEIQSRPRVHGRIHVAEVPLIGRKLPIWMGIQAP